MSERKRATLLDVAAHAGVSPITVSRALRSPHTVSEGTRSRIMVAVEDLDYRPNPVARALATGRTEVIGVLIPSVTNAVFADVLRGIYDAVEDTCFNVQLANTRYSNETEEGLLGLFLSQHPSAMIVTGFDQSQRSRDLLLRFTCPLVQIMEMGPHPADMVVGFSHKEAARAAALHLLEAGYRNLGFLGARMDPRAERRFAGYREAAEAAGAFDPARCITVIEPSTVSLGAMLFRQLLERQPETDAVFCVNDDLALGSLFEAQRMGLTVPGRIGICGFNDLEPMAAAEPPLTSVRTNRYEIGRQAVVLLKARLAGKSTEAEHLDLGYQVIARRSTSRSGAPVE